MARLELFDIRRKPQLFAWHVDCFGCDYHIEKSDSALKIYAEYNIICEAQYLYLFDLVKGPNGFTLKFFSERDVDADFIQNNKAEVVKTVVDKILKETTLGESWTKRILEEAEENLTKKEEYEKDVKDYLNQEEELKKVLREKLEEFIG